MHFANAVKRRGRSVLDGFHRMRNVANLIWFGLAAGRQLHTPLRFIEVSLRLCVLRLDHVHCVSIPLYHVSDNIDLAIIYLATGARQINGTQFTAIKVGQPPSIVLLLSPSLWCFSKYSRRHSP